MVAGSEPPFRDAVDAALMQFLAQRRAELVDLGPQLDAFLDAAGDFVRGGKRLRPRFCRAGWLAAGGDPDDPRLPVAAASWEWLQASALVHDDLMDASDTRRGRPSVHRAAEAAHRDAGLTGSAADHGASYAILLGDLMLSWADEQLRASGLETVWRALPFLDRCRAEVVAGQYLDVVAQTRDLVTVEQALQVVRYKTAKYTVERPLHVGAALAGGDDVLTEALTAVALPLGAAFQLRDDVLGVFGDPVQTGKPAGDDLREGKRTLLVARTQELADDAGRTLLHRLLGSQDGIDTLRDLIVSCGALASVEDDITRLQAEAEAAVERLPASGREALHQLVGDAVHRSR